MFLKKSLFIFIFGFSFLSGFSGVAYAQQDVGNVVWSPDGKYLAFYATWHGDREIYITRLDTPEWIRQLTVNEFSDSSPSFTRDGTAVLYTSKDTADGDNNIYRVSLDGENTQKLFGEEGINEGWPIEAPDGRIYYTTRPKVEEGVAEDFDIHVWDPATNTSKKLVDSDFQDVPVSVSADGARLAFGSTRTGNSEVFIANIDGSNQQRLTSHSLPGEEGSIFGSGFPRFDPEGKKLLVWTDDTDLGPFNFHFQIIDIETGDVETLPRKIRFTALPSLSPDGTEVAFAATTEEDGLAGPWRVYIMKLDGTEFRRIYPPSTTQ